MADGGLMTRSSEAPEMKALLSTPNALVMPSIARIEEHPSWSVLARLPVTLTAGILLNRFKVRDLLNLREGQVFGSRSRDTEDVPLRVGQVQLGWSEFEVVEQRLSLRLTRLV